MERSDVDILICSGAAQAGQLEALLPLLRPHGRVHVASSRLTEAQIARLEGQYDVLHRPEYVPHPYRNFEIFASRDINRLATAPWFIKLDTDVQLSADWFEWVRECIALRPDAVLFGPHAGNNRIDYDISGPLVRRKLGRDVRVRNGVKVVGSFYVGRTDFFRKHDHTMQTLHDLIYCFRDGRRIRPSELGDEDLERDLPRDGLVRMRGRCANRQALPSEDNLRNLTVYFAGAARHLFVRDPDGRIRDPDKIVPLSRWAKTRKWIRGRAGVPLQPPARPDPTPNAQATHPIRPADHAAPTRSAGLSGRIEAPESRAERSRPWDDS